MTFKPSGDLISVKGRKLHVRKMGKGNKTIILLPGWGMLVPSVEFAPLMRELSKKYTVCVIEYFGYGHSDSIDTPRTNENYVQEIREALSIAGLKPPYFLMPYSASGIYSEYYASKYPSEIEGLILFDCYSSAENIESVSQEELDEFVTSYNNAVLTDEEFKEFIDEYLPHGYTPEETKEVFTIGNHMDTLRNQYLALFANIKEVMFINYQLGEKLPILVLHSDNSDMEDISQIDIEGYEKYRKNHIDKLGKVNKHVIIKGSNHFDIYNSADFRKLICCEVDEFIDGVSCCNK